MEEGEWIEKGFQNKGICKVVSSNKSSKLEPTTQHTIVYVHNVASFIKLTSNKADTRHDLSWYLSKECITKNDGDDYLKIKTTVSVENQAYLYDSDILRDLFSPGCYIVNRK